MLILESNMSQFLRRLRAALLRVAGLFHTRRRDQDLADELESHLQMHLEENLRAGLGPTRGAPAGAAEAGRDGASERELSRPAQHSVC